MATARVRSCVPVPTSAQNKLRCAMTRMRCQLASHCLGECHVRGRPAVMQPAQLHSVDQVHRIQQLPRCQQPCRTQAKTPRTCGGKRNTSPWRYFQPTSASSSPHGRSGKRFFVIALLTCHSLAARCSTSAEGTRIAAACEQLQAEHTHHPSAAHLRPRAGTS